MIEVKNIYKSFGENDVLNGFSAVFEKGVISFITGESGKGKTTLLRIILGLEKADSGEVIKSGIENFGVVFQEDRLFEKLSIEDNIRYVTDNPINHNLADELGLIEYLNKPINKLSGGTKRRCAVLRALSVSADALILDEPFNGLDDNMKRRVMETVVKYSKEKVVIISTHDKHIIDHVGNRAKIFEI